MNEKHRLETRSEPKSVIGKYVDHLLRENGWSYRELSRRTGIRNSTFYLLRTGQTMNPTARTIERIAAAFNVPIINITQALKGIWPQPGKRSEATDGLDMDLVLLTTQLTHEQRAALANFLRTVYQAV